MDDLGNCDSFSMAGEFFPSLPIEGGGFDRAPAIAGVAGDEDGEGSIHGCVRKILCTRVLPAIWQIVLHHFQYNSPFAEKCRLLDAST
jgi:hypothetical protein